MTRAFFRCTVVRKKIGPRGPPPRPARDRGCTCRIGDEMLDQPLQPLRSAAAGLILLIARILMGYIFVLSGWGKLMSSSGLCLQSRQRGPGRAYLQGD